MRKFVCGVRRGKEEEGRGVRGDSYDEALRTTEKWRTVDAT
jgi:hypothetical protein